MTTLSDLILQYADQYKSGDPKGLSNLQTLWDSSKRQEERATRLVDAYLTQIHQLQQRTSRTETSYVSQEARSSTSPKSPPSKSSNPSPSASVKPAPPKPQVEKHKNAMDLGDLLL